MHIKEEYKIKYQELILTGNIPKHPKFLYEYHLPKDFLELKEQFYGVEQKQNDYKIYFNGNEFVLATNITPIVIGYKSDEL